MFLYRGMNLGELNKVRNDSFKNITWWTSNVNNMFRYYEGGCIKIEIDVDEAERMEYIRTEEEACVNYTFGSAEMKVPEDSIWFSISKDYLLEHIVSKYGLELEIDDDDNVTVKNKKLIK
jgi:hypothetical protein